MKSNQSLLLSVAAVSALAVAGCHHGGGAGGGASSAAAAASFKSCGPDGLIDDAEDNNNQTAPVAGRGGYWYSFVDKIGSTITPAAGSNGGTFSMTAGGANNSKFAANMKGKIGKADQPPDYLFAGMGFNFQDPKAAYDASKYKGISFWAKKGPGSSGKIRLKVPDAETDPEGKMCKECFNDYGSDLNLTETWTKYTVPFAEMKQLSGWGSPTSGAITPGKIYGLQFQINQPGASYDVSIDDLEFICQ
jgi:endoglucanase